MQRLLCGILSATTVIACSGNKTEEPPPPPPPPGAPHDGLSLLDPGKGPFRPLRYHLTRGTKVPIELTMEIDIKAEEQTLTPTLVLDMNVAVEDVLADGTAKIKTTVTHGSVRERPGVKLEGMSQQAALLDGMSVAFALAPDGTTSESHVEGAGELPKTLSAQVDTLSRSVDRLAMPLPGGPVGIGARWKNRKTVEQNGVKMIAETTIELVAIDGDKISYKSTAQFTGAPQAMEQAGVQLDIKKADGSLTSSGVMDLARMVMQGTYDATFHFDMVVTPPKGTPGGGPSSVEIKMKQTVTPDVQPPPPIPSDAGADAQGAHRAP